MRFKKESFMEAGKGITKDYYVIDIVHILKSLWHRAWLIAACALLVASIGFSMAAFFIAPTYSSSIMVYINNSSVSLDNLSDKLSLSDISAAQSLVKTYSVILKNRTTLNQVIKQAGVEYDWEELNSMISVSSVNDTEIMQVTVKSKDPEEAMVIANEIGDVLKARVVELIDGTSMNVVDWAVADYEKVAPSVTKYTVVGGIIGAVFAIVILVALALMDNTIHDEDYILQNYDYPILAKVPDLNSTDSRRYGGSRYAYYKRESSR